MGPPEPSTAIVPAFAEDDRTLVAAVLSRIPGSFEELVRRNQTLCWHIINRMVRHPEDTRDLCQETFIRVHKNLHQYRFESALKSWIGQVAYSVAIRHLQRKRLPMTDVPWDDNIEVIEKSASDIEFERQDERLLAEMHLQIEQLPATLRAILTMYHLDNLSVGEIATITGLPAGTVKSHLFRCRAKLRERLQVFKDLNS